MNKTIIITIGLFLFMANAVVARCTLEEWQALQALYISTDGDNWDKKDGWENILQHEPPEDCNFKNFYGIDGVNDGGNIIELYFEDNNLIGTLPTEISMLTYLEQLVFSNNIGLTGVIPASLGELNNLFRIRFDANNLTGSIPPELANLSNLVYLNLSFNELSGNIPPELSTMQSIGSLDLFRNNLTGSIPPEFGSSRFIMGGGLLLFAFNNLSGCYDSNLKNLCGKLMPPGNDGYITLSVGNNFDAEWEDFCDTGAGTCDTINRCHFTDWQALQSIYQNYNGSNWHNLAGWDSLILNQDTIPDSCNLDELYGVTTNANGRVDSIDLSGNQLSGNFNVDWLNLDSLTYLNIADNNFSGCFDSLSIGLCKQLNSPYFISDSLIDKGNDFEATWEFFCTYQTCDTTSTSIFNIMSHQPIHLFPNPASEFVYVHGDFPFSVNVEYQIISIEGKQIEKSVIEEDRISVASLKTGTYFLIIKDNKKTYLSRFVKI